MGNILTTPGGFIRRIFVRIARSFGVHFDPLPLGGVAEVESGLTPESPDLIKIWAKIFLFRDRYIIRRLKPLSEDMLVNDQPNPYNYGLSNSIFHLTAYSRNRQKVLDAIMVESTKNNNGPTFQYYVFFKEANMYNWRFNSLSASNPRETITEESIIDVLDIVFYAEKSDPNNPAPSWVKFSQDLPVSDLEYCPREWINCYLHFSEYDNSMIKIRNVTLIRGTKPDTEAEFIHCIDWKSNLTFDFDPVDMLNNVGFEGCPPDISAVVRVWQQFTQSVEEL